MLNLHIHIKLICIHVFQQLMQIYINKSRAKGAKQAFIIVICSDASVGSDDRCLH